ncbi:aspartic peptidase domain-containing protein [Fomitopsis serialis]|uniref:aspartic peptidase domain-containing protein n=1 Tax=Fomitopsis serialis TaxID=139415 RepID=UPI0020078A55|nr:aspartic peptidase domain-containing protein [Neoantrodia serialis]KAH9936202.1 aspartic peptidase domain-containing protein [Neoantrodia serialis]
MCTAPASLCVLLFLLLPLAVALPVQVVNNWVVSHAKQVARRGLSVPLQRREVGRRGHVETFLAGTIGVGDVGDTFYTVAINVGNTTTAVNLDTGSSDLWIMSDTCQTPVCQKSTAHAYPTESMQLTGATVNLTYGDSTTGTFASGPIVMDEVTLAGLSMPMQPLAAISNTNNMAVLNGGAGIVGLGFPSQSSIQSQVVNAKFGRSVTANEFVSHMSSLGPLVSRMVADGMVEQPLFSVTLQRDTIDVSGTGQLTIGELPDGIDNSSLTWVPVRLYSTADGGLQAPSFASNETYPLRWEVPIGNVYLDGKPLANSTVKPNGVTTSFVDALIDTGNSLIRGPSDVVNSILRSVSPAFARSANAKPMLSCNTSHTLAFEIGGQLFSVDPRDFLSQSPGGNATQCIASSVTATDPPGFGSLFRWSLGDPFLKSNLVAFYYGNLTNPSVDPPRIGFLSMVPSNASALLTQAVTEALKDGGKFEGTSMAAPTSSTVESFGVITTSTSAAPTSTTTAVDKSSSGKGSSAAMTLSRSLPALLIPVLLVSLVSSWSI